MDFLGKLSEKGKVAADKAKDLAEVASLKAQIATNENVIKKTYTEIGKIYYQEHSLDEDIQGDLKTHFDTVVKAKAAIAEIQTQIDVLKGVNN